jgi:hypothetical protein
MTIACFFLLILIPFAGFELAHGALETQKERGHLFIIERSVACPLKLQDAPDAFSCFTHCSACATLMHCMHHRGLAHPRPGGRLNYSSCPRLIGAQMFSGSFAESIATRISTIARLTTRQPVGSSLQRRILLSRQQRLTRFETGRHYCLADCDISVST